MRGKISAILMIMCAVIHAKWGVLCYNKLLQGSITDS